MSKKTQILCILTTMIFGVAMFIATSYKTSYADEVEGVYQVYLNGEKIGMIGSQDELYALINEEQSSIKEEYNVYIMDKTIFKGNKKWSDKLKDAFLSRGVNWTDTIEEKVKMIVTNSIPDSIGNIKEILIEQKSGFIQGLSDALEAMLESESK